MLVTIGTWRVKSYFGKIMFPRENKNLACGYISIMEKNNFVFELKNAHPFSLFRPLRLKEKNKNNKNKIKQIKRIVSFQA